MRRVASSGYGTVSHPRPDGHSRVQRCNMCEATEHKSHNWLGKKKINHVDYIDHFITHNYLPHLTRIETPLQVEFFALHLIIWLDIFSNYFWYTLHGQHPSRTGPSRWRGCNHCSHDNLQQDLADRRMANPVDPVHSHHTSQERQPAAVPDLPTISLISHPSKIMLKILLNRLKPQAEKIITEEQANFRAGRRTQSRSSTYAFSVRISPAPARPLPHLHRLQEGLWQGLACSFVGNHEEVQHQHKPYPSHQKPL